MENSKFGDRFRYAMKLRKMSQLKISEITGIAQGTLSNYAKNKYMPKDTNLDLIANALGVSKSYLRGYTDNPDRLGDDGHIVLHLNFTQNSEPVSLEFTKQGFGQTGSMPAERVSIRKGIVSVFLVRSPVTYF